MEINIFLTSHEFVNIINELLVDQKLCIYMAKNNAENYKIFNRVTLNEIQEHRNYEIGLCCDDSVLLRKVFKDIYREDRVDYVSIHFNCCPRKSEYLLVTTFIADSSQVTKNIFKNLKKIISKISNKGVRGINDNTNGVSVYSNYYWTNEALNSNKIWKQIEGDFIRFLPMQ